MKTGKAKIYWDSCVFIAWLKDETDVWGRPLMRGIEEAADMAAAGAAILMTSSITRTEVFMTALTDEQKAKFASLLRRSNVREISADPRITDRASTIRQNDAYKIDGKRMSTPDAIHIATALQYRAEELQTMDGLEKNKPCKRLLALNGKIDGLVIIAPYVRGVRLAVPSQERSEDQPDLFDIGELNSGSAESITGQTATSATVRLSHQGGAEDKAGQPRK